MKGVTALKKSIKRSLVLLIVLFTVTALSACDMVSELFGGDADDSSDVITPVSIESRAESSYLTVGETTSVITVFSPENSTEKSLEFSSSDTGVATVDENGTVKAIHRGEATITVTCVADKNVKYEFTVTVKDRDSIDFGVSEIKTYGTSGSVPILVASEDSFDKSAFSCKIYDNDGNEAPSETVSASVNITDGNVLLDYKFNDASFSGSVIIKVTFVGKNNEATGDLKIVKAEEPFLSLDESIAEISVSQTKLLSFTSNYSPEDFTAEVSTDNDNVTARTSSSGLIVTANKAGVTKITLTLKSKDSPSIIKIAEQEIVIKPKSLSVDESAKTYGIEGILTIGKHEYSYENGIISLVDTYGTKNAFMLHYSIPKTSEGETTAGVGFTENFKWISSHPDSVTIDEDGKIHVIDEKFFGIVDFYAEFSYGGISMTTERIKIRCIGSGVNVYSYKDLYNATVGEQTVVLHTDVKDDFGYIDGKVMYSEIKTTYDNTYYKNLGKENEAKVKVLLSFKNDIYGNGHVINAHNVTYKLTESSDGTKTQDPNALFQGPLDFVMATHTNKDSGLVSTISVKAQDNICFALYEGVTASNVELRGCDLTANSDGQYDLVDLTYIGTTVEALGDDVNIEYSRLTNGRTVLRAFGDIKDSTKEIDISITNSVLSGAREFIIRTGSNCFEDGSLSNLSPKLDGDTGTDYETKKTYNTMTPAQKAAYDKKYIKTYINIKNTVFKDAGLFAIGVDTHSAGIALADGSKISDQFKALDGLLVGWKNMAKTSYGAKVSFDGDVGLYNWKDINAVDSSTLIEITGNYGIFNQMTFDVKGMITELASKKEYSNILTNHNGNSYVHAGITFFGGGKNYGVFESKNGTMLYNYKMSFEDVNRPELIFATGEEPFYFFLYDQTSRFSPQEQENRLKTGEAYESIYKQ